MTGNYSGSGPGNNLMVDNQWHHIEIVYSATSHQVGLTVMIGANTILSSQGTVGGGFSANLDYLGVSMNEVCVTSNRHEVAYIDNVMMEVFPDK